MKILIIILLLSIVFSSQQGTLFLSNGKAFKITFESIDENGYVHYHTAEDGAVNYSLISIDDVSSLILDDGTIVITPPNSHINENISLVYTVQDITGTFEKEMNGVFLGVLDRKTIVKGKFNKTKYIGCDNLVSINNEFKIPVQLDCSIDTYQPKVLTEFDMPKESRGPIGGFFIALSAGVLLSNLYSEPNDAESFEKIYDRLEGTSKIGYILVIIGGLLIAVGV